MIEAISPYLKKIPLIAGYEQELASVIAFFFVLSIAVLVHLTTKEIAIRLASALIKLIKNSKEDMYKSRLILSKLTYLTPAAPQVFNSVRIAWLHLGLDGNAKVWC